MNMVITGASKGLGFATAAQFAGHGYNLVLTSRQSGALQKAVDDLHTRFPHVKIWFKDFDLAKSAQAKAFGQWVLDLDISIDVLLNNAGIFIPGNISEEADGALEDMINVNLYSAYHVTRTLVPKMMKQGSGHIFNMCSIASLKAYPNGGSYSISKFALAGFSHNLRHELKPHHIKVTAVYPGAVYTDSWAGSGIDPKRIMEADDVAQLIYAAAMLSPQATVEEILLRPQLGDI